LPDQPQDARAQREERYHGTERGRFDQILDLSTALVEDGRDAGPVRQVRRDLHGLDHGHDAARDEQADHHSADGHQRLPAPVPHVRIPLHDAPSRRMNSGSSMTSTPSPSAFAIFVPGFSPTTTNDVFLDTPEETRAPAASARSVASSRVI